MITYHYHAMYYDKKKEAEVHMDGIVEREPVLMGMAEYQALKKAIDPKHHKDLIICSLSVIQVERFTG